MRLNNPFESSNKKKKIIQTHQNRRKRESEKIDGRLILHELKLSLPLARRLDQSLTPLIRSIIVQWNQRDSVEWGGVEWSGVVVPIPVHNIF